MLKLQSEIKKLTATKQPDTSPAYATTDEHYLDEIEPDTDRLEPAKALKMGFVDTESRIKKNAIKSKSTEQIKKVGNRPSKQSVITEQRTNVGKDTEQTIGNLPSKDKAKMRRLYNLAKKTKNGSSIKCPVRELKYTRTRNRIFCGNSGTGNCADEYKNIMNPKRVTAWKNKLRKQERKVKA